MIDFSQWYEAVKASQTHGFPGWNGATIATVVIAVLIFAFMTFGFFADGDKSMAWFASILTAAVLTIGCFFVLSNTPNGGEPPENLATNIESTFDITVTDWNEREGVFQQNRFWPDDGIYDIVYIVPGGQKNVKGTVVVHGYSIGITDSDGTFLKEVTSD